MPIVHMNGSAVRVCSLLAGLLVGPTLAWAQDAPPPADWTRHEVNWRATGGRQVRAVFAPPGRDVPFVGKYQHPVAGRQLLGPSTDGILAGVINSPPINGFVPYVAVTATNKHDTNEYTAIAWEGVTGTAFVENPAAQYAIGLYDTGATGSVVGFESATQIGLYSAGQLTLNTTVVTGVTGSVECSLSKPLGLFFGGLQEIDGQSNQLNLNGLAGESNIAALIAPEPAPGAPDLFTAMAAPMAAYFNTVIRNDQPITRTVGGQTYTAPSIHLYKDASDSRIPNYPNTLLLNYLPAGDTAVGYFPCFSMLFDCPDDEKPMLPSLIGGQSLIQALFFLDQSNGIDLGEGTTTRTFYKVIVDTGAQITVIGSSVVSRLHLPTANPEFTVEVQGLDGQTIYRPGFYLDLVDIPVVSSTGEPLSFTHVPVVYLDVASPEGANTKLDGILGMNLLDKYNFVVHGGVLDGNPPSITFERVKIFGDANGDYDVDHDDFLVFQACMKGPSVPTSPQSCLAFDTDGDGDVDSVDFGAFQACFSGTGVDANPWCHPVP